MSVIKSFSVGNGDTFYIKHGSSNFTIIDCCLDDDNKDAIVNEIITESKGKDITRFISTHPDDDHICGLEYLDDKIGIINFYCVKNEATKTDESVDFDRYCKLRDSSKAFYLYKGCKRKWMNKNDKNDGKNYGSSGINIQWPIVDNSEYKNALSNAKDGKSPNNISPIFTYSFNGGATVMWMGDIENTFLGKIKDEIDWKKIDILFAPHHGRDSGKVPTDILNQLQPQIIVIGEAPSENLNYYNGYNTITQNTAGDIIFECESSKVHVYVSNKNYSVSYLEDENKSNTYGTYIGTLSV
ncbi:MBL fold metallo-hydrolase [Cytobacillus sp. Hz8]|uniref:MBL fold metallo-hydrolase n=1 Tax=Cytobacillus sp. Hz8 TaxID=3347168 RepID=UPI0035DA8F09